MVNFKFVSLAYLAANALFVHAKEDSAAAGEPEHQEVVQPLPQLNVTASTTFPNSEFGVKIVNGEIVTAGISFTNYEAEPVSVKLVVGQLLTLETGEGVRNLTVAKYQTEVPAGDNRLVSYPIQTEMHPADLRLTLTAIVSTAGSEVYTVPAFDGVVSIVEPPFTIFDPQILFLYFFLGSLFCGTLYFFYTVWVVPYLPAKQRKPASAKPKVVAKTENANTTGSDGATGASYNTEWIPAHHIARPEARKVKGSVKKTRP